MSRRLMSIIAGALLAVSALSLVASTVLGRASTSGASFSAAEVGTAPEGQRRALADGTVSLEEKEAAYEDQRRCLEAAGYAPGPAGVDGPGTGFEVEVDYSDEAGPAAADRAFLHTFATCEDEYVALVGRAYAAQKS